MTDQPLSGRKAQAARNDKLILEAAHEVFVANPEAPIAEVAKRAGVGISALYRRYPSKEDLLRKLCGDGLARHVELVREAVESDGDVWEAFCEAMRGLVAADTASITVKLAGTFTPTPDMFAAGAQAAELNDALMRRLHEAGAIRSDAGIGDVIMVTESLASVNVGDTERTCQVRLRGLELYLQALKAPGGGPLPSEPASEAEMNARWIPKDAKE